MVAIVSPTALKAPSHPEGSEWQVLWNSSNGDVIFADSISDIVGTILPGYNDLDDDNPSDPHLQARIDALVTLASHAQALVLGAIAETGAEVTEDELNAALRHKELPCDIDRWNPSEPLILLTTTYEPYSNARRPEGAILWLDPSNEVMFLESLRRLGEGELWWGEPT